MYETSTLRITDSDMPPSPPAAPSFAMAAAPVRPGRYCPPNSLALSSGEGGRARSRWISRVGKREGDLRKEEESDLGGGGGGGR
jgi:hypothetical protein